MGAFTGNSEVAKSKIIFDRVIRRKLAKILRNFFGGFPVIGIAVSQTQVSGDPADMPIERNKQPGRVYLWPETHIDAIFASDQPAQKHVPAFRTATGRRVGEQMSYTARQWLLSG